MIRKIDGPAAALDLVQSRFQAAVPNRLRVISKRTDSIDMLESIEPSNGLGHARMLSSIPRTSHHMISAPNSQQQPTPVLCNLQCSTEASLHR